MSGVSRRPLLPTNTDVVPQIPSQNPCNISSNSRSYFSSPLEQPCATVYGFPLKSCISEPLFTAISQASEPVPENLQRVQEISSSFKRDMQGCFHLGTDGVLRSFDENGLVVDYRQLEPHQVREMYKVIFSPAPIYSDSQKKRMEEDYRNADGRNVPLKKILDPDNDQRPPHLWKDDEGKLIGRGVSADGKDREGGTG